MVCMLAVLYSGTDVISSDLGVRGRLLYWLQCITAVTNKSHVEVSVPASLEVRIRPLLFDREYCYLSAQESTVIGQCTL